MFFVFRVENILTFLLLFPSGVVSTSHVVSFSDVVLTNWLLNGDEVIPFNGDKVIPFGASLCPDAIYDVSPSNGRSLHWREEILQFLQQQKKRGTFARI